MTYQYGGLIIQTDCLENENKYEIAIFHIQYESFQNGLCYLHVDLLRQTQMKVYFFRPPN